LRRRKIKSTREGEKGVVILLVAMFLLFVVAAMAALAIDLVTFYTARSEAQQAADGAALAGARVLANSGMTSADPLDTLLSSSAEDLARTIATQVAVENKVGGAVPNVAVSFNDGDAEFHSNPHVIVQVSRTDLPVFFSRIWGNTAATVKATATAEAYNPSGLNTALGVAPSVALTCVKPWLLPNLDPTSTTNGRIFDVSTGAIVPTGLLGWNSTKSPPPSAGNLTSACAGGICGGGTALPPPTPWKYYPGDQSSFPAPAPPQVVPACTTIPTPTPYQKSIAGCVATPIRCHTGVNINIDVNDSPARAKNTADAVNCLTHSVSALGDGDVVDPMPVPSTAPFTFQGGSQNPVVGARNQTVLVSDSLVTVPVIDSSTLTASSTSAPVIGFVQLFLNADGGPTPDVDPAPIQTKIINLVGCGTNASTTEQPVQGNGASAIAVRLITTQ
jgi:hypothetical protein